MLSKYLLNYHIYYQIVFLIRKQEMVFMTDSDNINSNRIQILA